MAINYYLIGRQHDTLPFILPNKGIINLATTVPQENKLESPMVEYRC